MNKLVSPAVVILHEAMAEDARVDDLDALVQADQVGAVLARLGWQVGTVATTLDIGRTMTELRDRNPDCVFNLVDSLGGSGRLITVVPSMLSAAGLRYTGSDDNAIFMSSQKLLAKRWMTLHGLPTPKWYSTGDSIDHDNKPWIVKSVWEHASLGIDDSSVVRGKRALLERIAQREAAHGGDWFAERYIEGREFNISVIEEDGEPRVLPIAEIEFRGFPASKPKIVGYAAKWQEDASEYRNTERVFPALSEAVETRLKLLVIKCWHIFRLRGYARIDVRMDKQGVPWVLEVNANPCLSKDAGFVAAAAEANISYERVIETIIEAALRSPGPSDLEDAA